MQNELLLLDRARSLDDDALTEIHDAYYVAIYRYISFRIADPQTAEDLTSEVFVRFLHALRDKNAPRNSLRGWLYGTASNVVKEQYRRQKKMKHTQLHDQIASGNASPEQQVEASSSREQLNKAMANLTADQQRVLALRYGSGMPMRELAETMGKSEGAVKMLRARAVKALSGLLSKQNE